MCFECARLFGSDEHQNERHCVWHIETMRNDSSIEVFLVNQAEIFTTTILQFFSHRFENAVTACRPKIHQIIEPVKPPLLQ